jgi:hypothetical protein
LAASTVVAVPFSLYFQGARVTAGADEVGWEAANVIVFYNDIVLFLVTH